MKSTWFFLSVLVLGGLWAPRAYSATVAVMPVQGTNLSEGECDAIGVLFSNAFSRDANVVVASPLETKSIRRRVQTSLEAATQMGVSLYAELTAMQLGTTVKLQGMLFGKDGREIYRAGTVAPSLDDMEIETAKLARALILRQPVPRIPRPEATGDVSAAVEHPEAPPAPVDPNATVKALGVKVAVMMPISSGRTFSPMMSAEFNGRVGNRGYFVEFGAGASLPTNSAYGSGEIRVSLLFLELGGSYYLSEGNTALYLGGGLQPGIWESETAYNYNNRSSGSLAAYGQLGVTLTRDSRAKFYGEIRVSQYLLGVADPVVDGNGFGTGTGSPYHPTLVAMQIGIGW
jgi:hypothetical protein